LNPDELSNGNVNFSKDIVIKRNYCVLGNFVKVDSKINEDGFIILMYFVDNTELVELRKKYENERATVGIIIIDNYDDLMQSLEDTIRTQILAEIDAKITRWMGYTNGILKKFERDKYILSTISILRILKRKSLTSWIRWNGFAAGEVPFCPRIFGHCKKRGKYIFLRRKDQGAGEKNES